MAGTAAASTPRLSRCSSTTSVATAHLEEGYASATARLCSLLVTRAQWGAPKLAARLGVPTVAVEECVRSGHASALLRLQLVRWIREAGEVPTAVPPAAVAAVLREGSSGGGQNSTNRNQVDLPDDDELDEWWGLDDATRSHFSFLRQSVGHSFFSVVNDPTEVERREDWGEWIGSAVFRVFDYGPTGGAGGDGDAASSARGSDPGGAAVAAGEQAADVLRTTLAQHPVSRTSFDEYLRYIGDAYQRNRVDAEGATKAMLVGVGGAAATRGIASPRDIPHPDAVPADFFDAAFDIRQVLSSVTEDGVVELMAEQLMEHEEQVETALMMHVHLRSQEFFEASQTFTTLRDDVGHALRDIRTTRGDVVRCGENLVERFMHTARLHRRRAALKCLADVTDQIVALRAKVAAVQRALDEHRYIDAASCIEAANAALCASDGEAAEIRALSNFPMHLAELRKSLLLAILAESDTLLHHSRWDADTDWGLLRDVLGAAAKLGCLGGCLQQYRNAAADGAWLVARSTIVSTLLSLDAVASNGAGAALSAANSATASPDERQEFLGCLRSTKTSHFVEVVSRTLDALSSYVRRAMEHADEIRQCVGELWSWEADASWASYSATLYHAVQACVVGVLEARGEDVVAMRFHEIEAVMRMSFEFINAAEVVLRRQRCAAGHDESGKALPGVRSSGAGHGSGSPALSSSAATTSSLGSFRALLLSQARAFFRRQHDKQQQKMLMVMSQEQWLPEEAVECMFQHFCDTLCAADEAAIAAARRLSVDSDAHSTTDSGIPPRPSGAAAAAAAAVADAPADTGFDRTLNIPHGGGQYCVANSLLILLQSLNEYDRYLCTFPFLASDIVMRIHDAIKLYDGQCAVLVLGAGAVDHGTLQSITIPHLAVGSQCMAFLAEFTPRLRERMLAVVPPKAARFVAALERVQRDLIEHRNEFYAKMIAMVRERIDQTGCDATQWHTEGNAFIMRLLREVARLIKAIKPLFGANAKKCVLLPLLHLTTSRLRDAIHRAPLADPEVSAKVWQDVLIYAVNVQKFGFSVIQASLVSTIADAETAILESATIDTEDGLRAVFLPAP